MASASPKLDSFSWIAAGVRGEPLQAGEQFARDGLLHVRGAIDTALAQALELHVQSELASRRSDGDKRWFGNVYGYEDQGKRWDLKLLLDDAVCNALENLLKNLQSMIEGKYKCPLKLSELAAMCTLPGDSAQPVHADTSHMDEHGVVTVFVALHDIDEKRGPTCMYPGTHTDSELHLGLKTLNENSGLLCTMKCGDCMIMDSRLLHRGTANASTSHRYLFYCSWMPEVGISRSSTNTILDSYRDRLILSKWREWIQEPPEAKMLALEFGAASDEGNANLGKGNSQRRPSKSILGSQSKRRKLWKGSQTCHLAGRSDQVQLKQFLAWLYSHGVNLQESGIEVRHSSKHGLGVFAAKRIHPGETLVRIPMSVVLHAGKIRDTDFAQQVIGIAGDSNCGKGIRPEELLWLYMIWGRDEPDRCPWYGYLQSLPSNDPNAWALDENAFRWLKSTPLSESTRRELDRQRARHALIVGSLAKASPDSFSMTRFSFENWLWARSCYISRAFQQRAFPNECVQPGWETDFLCPVLDILNHRQQAEVEWRFGVECASLMLPLSASAYEIGDEIYNLYGAALGNDTLLNHYGFCITKNPYNSVNELHIRLPTESIDRSLERFSSAGIPGAKAEFLNYVVCLHIPQPLHCDMLEMPGDLLRAVSLLILGCDYDEEAASCLEKCKASKALARALRQMLPEIAPLSWFSSNADKVVRKPTLPSRSSVEHSTAVYAWGYRRILHAAIACAEGEAEMAELAAQMDDCAGHVSEDHDSGEDLIDARNCDTSHRCEGSEET